MNPTEDQIERISRSHAFLVKAAAETDPTRGPLPPDSTLDEAVRGLILAKNVFESFLMQHAKRRR